MLCIKLKNLVSVQTWPNISPKSQRLECWVQYNFYVLGIHYDFLVQISYKNANTLQRDNISVYQVYRKSFLTLVLDLNILKKCSIRTEIPAEMQPALPVCLCNIRVCFVRVFLNNQEARLKALQSHRTVLCLKFNARQSVVLRFEPQAAAG